MLAIASSDNNLLAGARGLAQGEFPDEEGSGEKFYVVARARYYGFDLTEDEISKISLFDLPLSRASFCSALFHEIEQEENLSLSKFAEGLDLEEGQSDRQTKKAIKKFFKKVWIYAIEQFLSSQSGFSQPNNPLLTAGNYCYDVKLSKKMPSKVLMDKNELDINFGLSRSKALFNFRSFLSKFRFVELPETMKALFNINIKKKKSEDVNLQTIIGASSYSSYGLGFGPGTRITEKKIYTENGILKCIRIEICKSKTDLKAEFQKLAEELEEELDEDLEGEKEVEEEEEESYEKSAQFAVNKKFKHRKGFILKKYNDEVYQEEEEEEEEVGKKRERRKKEKMKEKIHEKEAEEALEEDLEFLEEAVLAEQQASAEAAQLKEQALAESELESVAEDLLEKGAKKQQKRDFTVNPLLSKKHLNGGYTELELISLSRELFAKLKSGEKNNKFGTYEDLEKLEWYKSSNAIVGLSKQPLYIRAYIWTPEMPKLIDKIKTKLNVEHLSIWISPKYAGHADGYHKKGHKINYSALFNWVLHFEIKDSYGLKMPKIERTKEMLIYRAASRCKDLHYASEANLVEKEGLRNGCVIVI